MNEIQNRMGSKVSVFIGTSLDGFIARTNGDLDWMQAPGGEGGGDYGYKAFVARIDAIVMGRKTFEKVLSFEAWPYQKPVIVLTHRPLEIPAKLRNNVETMAGSPREVVDRLTKRGHLRLYVDGGQTIQGFLSAGLVHELIISRLPILIATGIPLFGPLPADIRLRLLETHAFPGGMVQSTYEVEGRRPQT
ncbi:MAG: dihydrofolate reductase family protein [Nitrososphaera sp.]